MNINKKICKTIFICFLFLSIASCKGDVQIDNTVCNDTKLKTIDSLNIDLNKDNLKDIVLVQEAIDGSRKLGVKLKQSSGYKIIDENNKIIGCKTCGYQSGDPFTDLSQNKDGFYLNLESNTIHFKYKSGKIVLESIDIIRVSQLTTGINEKHLIYTPTNFGVVELHEINDEFIADLVNNESKDTHNSLLQKKDTIYRVGNDIVINNNDKKIVYKSLFINASTLSTSLEIVNNNTFYLIYENNGSSTKMQNKYKFIYNNGLFLIFKETIKMYNGKVGTNRIYFEKLKIDNQTYDDLETVANITDVEYFSSNSSAKTNIYNLNKRKIAIITDKKSGMDKFIDFTQMEEKEDSNQSMDIKDVDQLNNTAFYLEKLGDYNGSLKFLKPIIQKFPDCTVI